METALLKSFATWARKELIREVSARIAVVLAPAATERVEQPKAVEALEKAIAAAGRGDTGKAAVADRVAYTWFNRIIALRFMDAVGYTGVGVVSPRAGVASGQPEILAEAKRGSFDATVVGGKTRYAVTGLLNGTRRSDDPQGEAYALLLADYCRFWNGAMPFMFEREGDFTELLIPANLLADDSVPSRAVKVLTKEVCQDVEVIGWLYQFYISERKAEVFAGFKKNKKAGADEIPAATQLFTPHWIVRYLVENSLGRLWMLNHPSSRLVDQMQYYIAPVDEDTDFLTVARPEELKVVDPACGSGHMLTYAFDLLYAIYEEEGYAPAEIPSLILTNNLYGVEIDPRAGALAAFALTMKARAKQRTFFIKQVEPNVCVLDPIPFTPDEIDFLRTRGGDQHAEAAFWNQFEHAATLGSLLQPDADLTARLKRHAEQLAGSGDLLLSDLLDRAGRVIKQAEYLTPRYSVAVANPPYMGMKNAATDLVQHLKAAYPKFKSDLFSAFVKRCADICREHGLVGIMSPNVWMYISAHSELRRLLLDHHGINSLVELPLGGFEGATVQICAYTFAVSPTCDQEATFIRLVDAGRARDLPGALRQAVADPNDTRRFQVRRSSFRGLPGEPFVYWVADTISPAFAAGLTLSSVSYTRIGLITGDNSSYLREWFEVSHSNIGVGLNRHEAAESGLRWFPVSKGGEFRKWYGNVTSVVDWRNDGEELQSRLDPTGSRVLAHNFNLDDIFKEGVTWSKISSGRFSGRYQPAGYIFNDPAAALFPKEGLVPASVLLAYLSSTVADFLLRALNPTLNFQPGNVSSLPWSHEVPVSRVAELAEEALAIAKSDWDCQETSREFVCNPLVAMRSSAGLRDVVDSALRSFESRAARLAAIEDANNRAFAEALSLGDAVTTSVELKDVTLTTNLEWAQQGIQGRVERLASASGRLVEDLVSYSVGCMFGRYSLDYGGLVLADQGATVQDYLARVPTPTFAPDRDNVIPIVDGDWFDDDVVARFRTFLRAAFGDEHFEDNLRFITESLGVKKIRDYFVRSFYKDHVQRYKKRPIYWLFSSPRGSFNALIYMHRYTPSTVSTVLNEYLREFRVKMSSSLQQQERLAAGGGTPRQQAAAQKEVDRLRKVLLELEEYEHDVLYPLASRQLAVDLDDGVKANYPKFGAALKKIPGLEASDE